MTIRPATHQDLTSIHQLFVQTIRHTSAGDYSPAQIAVWIAGIENKARWTEAVESQFFIVSEDPSGILGFGSLHDGHYIDFLFTHRDHQSKGVASAIYSQLEERAGTLGSSALRVKASRAAQTFFLHRGFVDVKENHFNVSGVDIMNFEMEKSLQ